MKHKNEVFKYIKNVKYGFRYFKKKLNMHEISYNGGKDGCFIYVDLKSKKLARFVVKKLKSKNIFIRGNWPKPYDKGILISGTTFVNFKKFCYEFFKIINFYKKK